jgi:hypothetical protein
LMARTWGFVSHVRYSVTLHMPEGSSARVINVPGDAREGGRVMGGGGEVRESGGEASRISTPQIR